MMVRDRPDVRRTALVEGRPVHFRVVGTGSPVILLHGLSGSSRWWSRNVEALSRRLVVYSIDLPSFGDNRRWGKFVLDEAAVNLLGWMDAVGLDKPNVIGHSMGGWIAADLACRWPARIDRLVLVDAPLLTDERGNFRLVSAASGAARRLPLRFLPVLIADAVRAGPLTLRSAGREMRRADLGPDLDRITAPTLLIWGEHDRLLPLAYGRRVAAALGAVLQVIERAGHNPMWEEPFAFNRIALDFLTAEHPDSAQ